ncbi:polysaccharide biosynthesis/export family protein [Stieleria varia]|uniref:SLBB domain protein n=1 Tax=Stieleria varia TaxID=2528005 RepID=A0A5C6AFW8_9BACT|nr:polysaccharide biosynthesis/export family protein [Stieleria varia]TWT98499.1 SLBB domain protein [Stieleria varia]
MNRNFPFPILARRNPVSVTGTCLALCIAAMLSLTGCRTAASIGLPVSANTNALLPHATHLRERVGHRSDIATELAKVALPPSRVEAGDVLVIEPNDFNSPIRIQSDQTVQQDGTIELGDYGRFMVMGMTTDEIQQLVQTRVASRETEKSQNRIALASHRNSGSAPAEEVVDYGISVRLVNKEDAQFYVMGEVNAPGSYPLIGADTVLDALIAAGGLSDRANEHKIILTRPRLDGQPRQVLPVCFKQVVQLGDVSTNYQLQPGDRIYVPSITLWEDVKQSVAFGSDKSCPHCRSYER